MIERSNIYVKSKKQEGKLGHSFPRAVKKIFFPARPPHNGPLSTNLRPTTYEYVVKKVRRIDLSLCWMAGAIFLSWLIASPIYPGYGLYIEEKNTQTITFKVYDQFSLRPT